MQPRQPIITRNDVIKLPDELQHNRRNLDLAIDVVYINYEGLLYSVDRIVRLKLLSILGTRKQGKGSALSRVIPIIS